jgi:hypothetical protein
VRLKLKPRTSGAAEVVISVIATSNKQPVQKTTGLFNQPTSSAPPNPSVHLVMVVQPTEDQAMKKAQERTKTGFTIPIRCGVRFPLDLWPESFRLTPCCYCASK